MLAWGSSFFEQVQLFEKFDSGLARFEAIESCETFASEIGHLSGFIDDFWGGETVAQSDLEIRFVVGGSDLEHTGTELELDVIVRDNRDTALFVGKIDREGPKCVETDELLVTRVVGIDRNGGVTGDGFWASGGDGEVGARTFSDGDPEMVEEPVLRFQDDLLVRQSSARDGAPVHHPFAPVDEAFLEQVDKNAADAFRVVGVHRETLSIPIAGGAELPELLGDDAAVFFFPFPNFFEEPFAAEVVAVANLTRFFQGPFDDRLGRDPCVVGTWKPENLHAFHPGSSREDVLDRVVQYVAQSQNAGDVRRGDDNGVGLSSVGHGLGSSGKGLTFKPERIPFFFDALRFVVFGKL